MARLCEPSLLYLELFAAKRRQKPPFFLQSSQFTFGLPLELEKHGHTVSLRFTSWYHKNRLGGKSRFSGVSRLSCYYRVNSSVFSGL